jgi:large subunit ribosomal protein L24
MNKLRKNDEIIVKAGKDKGRRGTITSILSGKRRVVIENINLVKKHIKPNPNKKIEGGIVEQEKSLHISNVALYNPETKKSDRVSFKFVGDGRKKARYFKSNGKLVDL